MPIFSTEDPGATLAGFAEVLSQAYPFVFGTANHVLEIFRAADEEFCNNRAIWLSPLCTADDRSPCWAAERQSAWNDLFNRRGVELVQLHKGTFHLRTLAIDPDDLSRDADVKFLCLYLWLLRQHRCITSVSLSIPILAPRHQALFASLLKFTEYVQKCEIHGSDPLSASSVMNGELRVSALGCLSVLTELGLAAMHLCTEDGALLVAAVEKNIHLAALILIEVQIEAPTFAQLANKVAEHKRLEDFRLKMAINEPVSVYTAALSLLGKANLIRLLISVDCSLLFLLKSLVGNESLIDITIESTIVDVETLTALAELACKNLALKRLKAKVDLARFLHIRGVPKEIFRLAGASKLHSLVLSGSVLSPQVMNVLADGIGVSRSLKELHLEDCNLSCSDVLPFIRVIAGSGSGFEELNVGSLTGNDDQRRELLRQMIEAEVCHKITCVYNDCQVGLLHDALDSHVVFSKISLSYGASTEAEPVLRALRGTLKTLKHLSIVTQRPLSILGGQFLAYVLRNGEVLKVVRLRCRTRASSSIQILKGLADSKTVEVVTIERWNMNDNVQRTFVDALRQNRSIHRLEFCWNEPAEYANFKPALVKALMFNQSVSTLKMYQGAQRDEAYDSDLLQHVHRNEMILSWTVDLILRDDLCAEGAVAYERLKCCDAMLDLFEREADCSPRTAMNRLRAALMGTRSALYALEDAFSNRKDFKATPDARVQFENLSSFVRDEVVGTLGLEKKVNAPW
ncbi:uncharacterized protein LOC144105659 [Amblyomma americanum]